MALQLRQEGKIVVVVSVCMVHDPRGTGFSAGRCLQTRWSQFEERGGRGHHSVRGRERLESNVAAGAVAAVL